MGSLAYLGVAIAVALVVGLWIAWRGRRSPSMRAGMRDFRKRLDALDPANDPLARPQRNPPPSATRPHRDGGSQPEPLAKDGRSG